MAHDDGYAVSAESGTCYNHKTRPDMKCVKRTKDYVTWHCAECGIYVIFVIKAGVDNELVEQWVQRMKDRGRAGSIIDVARRG